MADTLLVNSPLELTTILIRHHGIHRGLWTLAVSFHVQGLNFPASNGDGTSLPGALLGVQGIGIRQVDVADPLTVDAGAVNPARGSRPGIAVTT
jgi:hypothetical protein